MKLSQGLAAIILLGSTAAAQAELTGTVTAVSDYDFRGISLSATDPALQGSIDWAAANGFYVGAWASNIDYGDGFDGNIELDLYGGFAGEIEGGMGWDVGLVWYTYPDSSETRSRCRVDEPLVPTDCEISDYPELYAGISYQWLELKQWYSNDLSGSDKDGFYTEGNASFELPANFTLGLHLGYNYGDAFDNTEYMDYSVSVGYTLSHFDFTLKWVDNDLSRGDALYTTDDAFNSEGRAIFSVSTTFPWSNE
jgi:uncharacterized protein (TIGR02001 family)